MLVKAERVADIGGMTTLHGRRHLRLAVRVVILAALVVAVLTGAGSASNESAAGPTSPPLTTAQKTAAMNALEAIAPPAGFHRYELWRVGTSPRSPAVSCLPAPAICFGSTTPLPTVTNIAARRLLAGFGVRADQLACVSWLINCPGYGTFDGYRVGINLTVIRARLPVRPGAPVIRPGTQVLLFVVRAK